MNKEQADLLLQENTTDIDNAVNTIGGFQRGEIIPIKTSFSHLNNICLGGLLPNLIIAILARPGHGKTYMAHQLREDILEDNDANIGLLLFNWEMPFFALLLVQIKKMLHKSYKDILSQIPTAGESLMIHEVTNKFRDERLTTINKPLTPQEFDTVTRRYIETNLDKDQLFIMVDHAGITKGKNKLEVMFELLEVMNAIKLDYPNKITFIVLSQLNRTIENIWRSKDTNPAGLRVTSEFIYNADAIMQFADVVCGLVIPQKGHMDEYTAVNKMHYKHLEEHFVKDGKPGDSTRLMGRNRIFYDYIKVRLPDNDPTLYCTIIDHDKEELIEAFSSQEEDYTTRETLNF